MNQRIFSTTLLLSLLLSNGAAAGTDYFSANRQMIRNGLQAILTCNGLFTSQRTLRQVFGEELAYVDDPRFGGVVGSVDGGDYSIYPEKRAVTVGGKASGVPITAAFREGIGCVVMAPHQSLDDIDQLPQLTLPYPAGDPAMTPWPDGDRLPDQPLAPAVDPAALQAASDWAFQRETPEQKTISLIVVYQGQIVHERYADGFDMSTRTRTWSTAKSMAAALIGILVDEERMSLDETLEIEWLPATPVPGDDPRDRITLRHVLNMSSGLYPVDSDGMEYATGSGLSYWAGAGSVDGARNRGLIRQPGSYWDYENYDTLLAVYAMK